LRSIRHRRQAAPSGRTHKSSLCPNTSTKRSN